MESNKEYKIEKLDKEKWKGYILPINYSEDYYYDIKINTMENGFNIPIVLKKLDKTYTHNSKDYDYPDSLFQDYFDDVEVLGIVDNGNLLAAIETSVETWSNRMVVNELFVHESIRKQGYGKKLMDLAKKRAKENHNRVLMLETQSSNVNAIGFYLSQGFTLIGFDSCCYKNDDIKRKEVRFNFGYFLE